MSKCHLFKIDSIAKTDIWQLLWIIMAWHTLCLW